MVAASPDYLARHGVPQRPDDLLWHACIRMRLGDNSFYKWELGDGERMVEVDVPGPFSVNESNTAVAAALDLSLIHIYWAKRGCWNFGSDLRRSSPSKRVSAFIRPESRPRHSAP